MKIRRVELEVEAGDDIGKVADYMVEVAQESHCHVHAMFNSVHLVADEYDDRGTIISQYADLPRTRSKRK